MNSGAGRAFAVFALLLTICVGVISYGGYQVVVQSRSQAQFNGTVLKVLLSVSGCRPDDTPKICTDRQNERARLQGDDRVEAVACRVRLALAGRPVPGSGEPCVVPLGTP